MLDGPLLEVEESLINAHQTRADFRPSPWPQAMAVTDRGTTDHESGFGASSIPVEANLHRQFVPRQIKEHKMPTVVDFRVEIGVAKAGPERERVFCQWVYRLLSAQGVAEQKPHLSLIHI